VIRSATRKNKVYKKKSITYYDHIGGEEEKMKTGERGYARR